MSAKRGLAIGLAATCFFLMPACGNTTQSNSNVSTETSSMVAELREFTAEDLKSICSIPEIYIIQGATEVDLSKVFTFDPSVILDFKLSPSDIDTTLESSRSIKITVTVDQQILAQK